MERPSMSDEVKLLPCDRCGGKRTVRDIKPGVDWLRVYPEQMPCPECTNGSWADVIEATRPTEQGLGVPFGSGHSAEPEPISVVSAETASVPNAPALRKVAAQIRHRLKDMELRSPVTWPASTPSAKTSGYVISEVADWQLRQWLHIIENSASAIEASGQDGETRLDAKHESAGPQDDAHE